MDLTKLKTEMNHAGLVPEDGDLALSTVRNFFCGGACAILCMACFCRTYCV